MITRTRLLPLLLLAACGGGGGSTDAGVDSGGGNPDAMLAACAEFDSPAGTISSYPGSFTGDLVGAGADLSAPIGRCTDERDWYDPAGEDQVVHLTGLTAGTLYGVILDSDADMSFYVATGCGDGEPLAGACLVFVDTEIGGGEVAEFTGPASGEAYLVIDNFDTGLADPDGGYTVTVLPAECTDNTGCTDVAKPLCFNYQCVECVSSLDCSDSGAPACDDTNTCVASLDECTNDDVSEPDDGPADATVIAEPTAGAPTLAFNSICNTPDGEGDWFELTVADDTELGFSLTWAPSSGADLDVYIWDANGEFVDGGLNFGTDAEAVRVALTAGVYHLQVDYFEPKDVTEALEYVLTVGVPECEDSFDCLDSSNSVCNAAGACGPGPEQCVTDDATDDTPGDDGPAAARDLTDDVDVPHTLSDGRICSAPGTELDYYKVTTTDAGEGLSVDLTWTGTTTDLDLRVFDATGAVLGLSFYGSEAEHVVLDYLPVGTYYIEVSEFTDAPETATVAYEITATRATAVACDMDSDCDDTYSTQVFRGDCVGGACQFLAGAGALTQGTACDSGDDCTSGRCSYVPFESDAAASVCTVTCTTTANCAALGGSFTCTTGLGTNFCVPGCADDLQCGALVSSSVPDSGQPWDYATCTSNVCGF